MPQGQDSGSRVFGFLDGEEVTEVTLDNGTISCSVLDYGCTLRTLKVPDRDGNPTDVLLGYDDIDSYVSRSGRLGATIGRYANRISKARFPLNGRDVELTMNRPPHHIHGGNKGFDKRIWTVTERGSTSVTMSYDSADGEEGYPGNLKVSVTLSLEGRSLRMTYDAVSDKDTVCSITNHSYFDLSGRNGISDHTVRIDAERFISVDGDGIPEGTVSDVSERNDLRSPRPMSDGIPYDVCYLLSGKGGAECRSSSTGIRMAVSTDLPALQFYTGDGLKPCAGKDGKGIGPRSGLCFETQMPVDAPNNPVFGDCVLRKGERYLFHTAFVFDTYDV